MARQLQINQPFDLKRSLTMGQAFRWDSLGNRWFLGVLGENLIHIGQPDGVDGAVFYRIGGPNGERQATSNDDEMLLRYFREDDDVEGIYADISRRDEHIRRLVRQYRGMRVLRQEPWECIVSYICSANNSIEGISRCVEALSDELGQPVNLGEGGESRLTFPSPEQLTETTEKRLRELKLGFRAPYVIGTSNRVADAGINLENFKLMSYQDAKTRLMQYDGIGPKVADCIALMSLDKLESFPVDTHIRKLVTNWWFSGGKPPSDARIAEWAQDYFGPYAGYAGQFIFCDRAQAGNATTSDALSEKIDITASKSRATTVRNLSRHANRNYPCPKCGSEIGRVCRYPSGYRYEKGHSERGPR